MSVALTSPLSLQNSAPELLANSAGRQGTPSSSRSVASIDRTEANRAEKESNSEITRVTLGTDASSPNRVYEFSTPYAEVWRDGIKIATIDATGGVTASTGLVASVPGSANQDGPLLAARRAAQIAAATGGQVQIAGQAIDRETMGMRARLQVTYGRLQ